VLNLLEHGEAQQRVRVLSAAAEINVQFARPTLVDLARALLSHEFGRIKNCSLPTFFNTNMLSIGLNLCWSTRVLARSRLQFVKSNCDGTSTS